MKYYSKGSFSIVGYNKTSGCDDWKQPGGTGITINSNMVARKDKEDFNAILITSVGKEAKLKHLIKDQTVSCERSLYRSC